MKPKLKPADLTAIAEYAKNRGWRMALASTTERTAYFVMKSGKEKAVPISKVIASVERMKDKDSQA